ncbi:MAG: HAD-IB family phosphatase [Ignavibacteria bacterium]|nr:HAD-IB family phosphatase [Ignavibacteria bacterium]
MKYYILKIFCDFDGTVTKNDVWVNSLGKFIKDKEKFQQVCYEFDNAFISARECIKRELGLVGDFNFDKFNREVDKEEIDIYFHKFLSYCNENNYDIFLISEGLDYYINRILKREGLEHLKLFCNEMTYYTDENGKIILSCEFPYSDEVCSYCGMSKRNILITNTNDYENEISVLIGDGTSDFCAASYADIVFAKGKLASYCWKNNITYFEYKNFNDIINKIEKLKAGRQLKQRQTARGLRRDVFLGG